MKLVDDAEAVDRATEDVRRAQYATEALNNPLIKEYFFVAKAALFERIGKTKHDEVNVREQIYMEMMQLDRFQSNFQKAITKGKDSESWLTRLANKTQNIIKR